MGEIYFDPVEHPELAFLNDEDEEEASTKEKLVKGKPVVTSIVVAADKIQKLNELLSLPCSNKHSRIDKIRKVYGGVCTLCEAIPSTKVSYDCQGRSKWNGIVINV